MDIPPAPLNHADEKLTVTVDLDILSILDISEVASEVDLQFRLALTWHDRRLTMINLRDNLTLLSQHEVDRQWQPRLVFANTESKAMAERDEKSEVAVIRMGKPTVSPITELEQRYWFKFWSFKSSLFCSMITSFPLSLSHTF